MIQSTMKLLLIIYYYFKSRVRILHGILLLAVLVQFAVPGVFAEKFTIAVIGDTQAETQSYPALFNSRLQWLADNRASLNLKFVVQVGDLVQFDQPDGYPLAYPQPAHYMYTNADTGFDILDAVGVPYAICVGNHDTAVVGGTDTGDWTGNCTYNSGSVGCGEPWINIRITDTFSLPQFFPPNRFPDLQSVFESGKSDNCYHTFSAGGVDWLVVNNELNPRAAAFQWAKDVVAAHPNHNVIYITHSFMHNSGLMGKEGYVGDGVTPTEVRDQLLKVYPNVKMVYSGHVGSAANMLITGNSGNTVYCFVQNVFSANNAWTRTLEIDTSAGTIESTYFATNTGANWTSTPTNVTYSGVSFVPSTGDGGTGVIEFASSSYGVSEDAGVSVITVSRTGGSSGAVNVRYATGSGTAEAGPDYTAVSGTLSWTDGDSADKTFEVFINDDTEEESDETVALELSDPSAGASLGLTSGAELTITDDDGGTGAGAGSGTGGIELSFGNVRSVSEGSMNFRMSGTQGNSMLKIFTLAGQLVKTLQVPSGTSSADWDLLNSRGAGVKPGMYICVITDENGSRDCRKIILTN